VLTVARVHVPERTDGWWQQLWRLWLLERMLPSKHLTQFLRRWQEVWTVQDRLRGTVEQQADASPSQVLPVSWLSW